MKTYMVVSTKKARIFKFSSLGIAIRAIDETQANRVLHQLKLENPELMNDNTLKLMHIYDIDRFIDATEL